MVLVVLPLLSLLSLGVNLSSLLSVQSYGLSRQVVLWCLVRACVCVCMYVCVVNASDEGDEYQCDHGICEQPAETQRRHDKEQEASSVCLK